MIRYHRRFKVSNTAYPQWLRIKLPMKTKTALLGKAVFVVSEERRTRPLLTSIPHFFLATGTFGDQLILRGFLVFHAPALAGVLTPLFTSTAHMLHGSPTLASSCSASGHVSSQMLHSKSSSRKMSPSSPHRGHALGS